MRETTLEDARGGFTAHAIVYVMVMAALIILNLAFLTGSLWVVVPLVGWGIVLALHYLFLRRAGKPDAHRQARTEQRAATAKRAA